VPISRLLRYQEVLNWPIWCYTDIFKIELSMLNSNFQREQNELSRLNSISPAQLYFSNKNRFEPTQFFGPKIDLSRLNAIFEQILWL